MGTTYNVSEYAGGRRGGIRRKGRGGGAGGPPVFLPLTTIVPDKHFLEDESNTVTDSWEKGP